MTGQKNSEENLRVNHEAQSFQEKISQKHGRWLWLGVAMTGMAMLSATLGGLFAVSSNSQPLMQSKLSPEQAAVFDGDRIAGTGLEFSQLTRPVNVLLLGMSVLPPDVKNPPPETLHMRYQPELNSFEGLSDVILLLRFNPDSKKLTILSIPRDTRVLIEGHGVKKINAANTDGGAALTAQTVEHLLQGVEIDRYIRINVLGVSKLIDALGGINFNVPKAMHYQDETQHLYINLKAGQQHLNGDQTLQLLRFRYDALGDIGRIQRQQKVMQALVAQSLNPVTIARLPQIIDVIKSHIDTNLTVEELIALLGFAVQTNRSKMEMLMLPGRFSEPHEFNASYWVPYPQSIATMMAQHFDTSAQLEPVTTETPSDQTTTMHLSEETEHKHIVKAGKNKSKHSKHPGR